jgi:hypothetical protein
MVNLSVGFTPTNVVLGRLADDPSTQKKALSILANLTYR